MTDQWKQNVMAAVDPGDGKMLEKLLASQNQRLDFNIDIFSPLTRAAFRGHNGIAQQLLLAEASVDFCHNYRTPLMEAASWGKADVCQLLLSHGADVNLMNKTCDYTALRYAALAGDHQTAVVLLEHGAQVYDFHSTWDVLDSSPLAEAIATGRTSLIQLFLDHLDHDKRIPLQLVLSMAMYYRQEECSIFILQHACEQQGFHFVKRELAATLHPSMMTSMVFYRSYTSLFHWVADRGHVKLMNELINLNPFIFQEEWLVQEHFAKTLKENIDLVWLVSQLVECRKQPPSLIVICKSIILAQLGSFYKPKITALPLPESLKAFLASKVSMLS